MDKAEAKKIANRELAWFGQPEERRINGFIAVACVYGQPIGGNLILSREVAEDLLRQIQEHPTMTYNTMLFRAVRGWIEGDEKTGKLLVEYRRVEECRVPTRGRGLACCDKGGH